MPIELRLEGADQLVRAGGIFARAADQLQQALVQAAKAFAFDALNRSQKDYLSGPRPDKLGAVSNRLRSSIATDVRPGDKEIYVDIGTNVSYGRVHEYGFKGSVSVKQHTRTVKQVFGRSVTPFQQEVSAHSRQVDLQQRAFLAPAIQDALPAFEESIGVALENVGREI